MVAILALQALVLAVGGALTFMQVRHATAMAVQDLVLEENVRIAEWVGEQLSEGVEGPLEYGSGPWEVVQQRVEGLVLPGHGFACLIDDGGKILCHPDLRRQPRLRGQVLGSTVLIEAGEGEHVMLNSAPLGRTVSGRLRFSLGETHYVATRHLPGLGARLIVHQPESGLVALSTRATFVVGLVAAGAGATVIGLTALSTIWVMRRYDSALEVLNRGLEAEVERRTHENLRARDALIMGLAKLADCRDSETGLHLERISRYSTVLAGRLGERFGEIDEAWLDRLRLASSMHDIGKVGVPDAVLLKPGRLTPEERERMQTHTTIGADTLLAIRAQLGDDELLDMSVQVALEHHERWDGTGYPLGLAGEQIAPAARIVALADVYDALTSARVYKPAMPHERAREIILEGRGTHFDPAVVDAFLAAEAEFEAVAREMHPGGADPRAGAAALAAAA